MKHFPIFLAVENKRIVLSGGGDAALAKLRLLMKTEAKICVFAENAAPEIFYWAADGKLSLTQRALQTGDVTDAVLFYAADEDAIEDARTAAIAASEGALVNIVDNLHESAFITPAIVDRDPVTIAIGTEGAAPVLARAIKADLEATLPASLGTLARTGKNFRHAVDVLPMGAKRRAFWSEFYFTAGPAAMDAHGEAGILPALEALLDRHIMTAAKAGHVDFVGAGTGDADLLTLKARKAIDKADVIIHDGRVTAEILELARREATIFDAGSEDAASLVLAHIATGAHVVRLKHGSGRINEEAETILSAGVSIGFIAGIAATDPAQIIPFPVHALCTPSARLVTSQFYASEAI